MDLAGENTLQDDIDEKIAFNKLQISKNRPDFDNIKKKYKFNKIVLFYQRMKSTTDFLHKINIVHRDIKPKNILLKDGIEHLSDFGLALVLNNDEQNKTITGQSGVQKFQSYELVTKILQLENLNQNLKDLQYKDQENEEQKNQIQNQNQNLKDLQYRDEEQKNQIQNQNQNYQNEYTINGKIKQIEQQIQTQKDQELKNNDLFALGLIVLLMCNLEKYDEYCNASQSKLFSQMLKAMQSYQQQEFQLKNYFFTLFCFDELKQQLFNNYVKTMTGNNNENILQ